MKKGLRNPRLAAQFGKKERKMCYQPYNIQWSYDVNNAKIMQCWDWHRKYIIFFTVSLLSLFSFQIELSPQDVGANLCTTLFTGLRITMRGTGEYSQYKADNWVRYELLQVLLSNFLLGFPSFYYLTSQNHLNKF